MGQYFIFVVVAAILVLIIATLILAVLIQRRRQRIMLLLALAQEDANRRRKRRRTGLRRCEIDSACPEAIVTKVSDKISAITIYPVEKKEYEEEINQKTVMTTLSPPPPVHDPEEISFSIDVSDPFTTNEYATVTVGNFSNPRSIDDDGVTDEHEVSQPHSSSNVQHISADSDNVSASDPEAKHTTRKMSYRLVLPTSQETCAVCLDNMEVGAPVRALPCNHVYHSSCIRAWLRRKNACPCCCEKVFIRNKKRPPTPPRTPPPSSSLNQSPTTTSTSVQIRNEDRVVDRSEYNNGRPVKNISFGALEPSESSFSRIGSLSSSQFDDPDGMDTIDRNPVYGRGGVMIPVSSAISDGMWSESAAETSMSDIDMRTTSEFKSNHRQQALSSSANIQKSQNVMAYRESKENGRLYAQRGSVRDWIDDRSTQIAHRSTYPMIEANTSNQSEHLEGSRGNDDQRMTSSTEIISDAVAETHRN